MALQEMRRIFENNFVASLMYSGVDAVSSLQLMPGEEKLTKETIQAALKGSNIDAVIVTRLVGINVKYTKSPGGYYAVPYAYYNDFYSYYNQVYTYAIVEAAPVYEAKETVSLETNLYGVENAKLIWAVVSKTLKKDSVIDSIDSLTSKLIGKLIEDGLV